MKLFSSLLLAGTFAVVTSSHAQDVANQRTGGGGSATDEAVGSISGIHRPTPTPGTTASASKPTGPLAAELAKDAKGKSTASTFTPNDTVYFICTNVTAKKGDKLGVAWFGGKKERKVFGSTSDVPKDGVYNPSYNLPPPKGGSPGGHVPRRTDPEFQGAQEHEVHRAVTVTAGPGGVPGPKAAFSRHHES